MRPLDPRPPAPAARRRGAREITLGVLAALALLVGIACIPLLLVLVAPLNPSWPSWSDLSQPDDGQLLLTVVTLIAWTGWAVFALSVVLEIVAVARGAPTPRVPLLRTPQAMAAGLVAAAAVLVSIPVVAPPPAAAATETSAPVHVTQLRPGPAVAASTEAEDPGPHRAAGPRHAQPAAPNTDHGADTAGLWVTVRHGDTLWGLAERHLGVGTRYREIAELNYGRTQPDGRALTNTHWIYPGWRLRLPTDTTVPVSTANGGSPSKPATVAPRTYVVRPGDTLWDIARRQLGDGTRAHELFALNADHRQPDGQAFRDPALIRPGWVLLLPAPGSAPVPQPPARQPAAQEKPSSRPAVPAQRPSHDRTAPSPQQANRIPPATPGPTPPADNASPASTPATTAHSDTAGRGSAADGIDSAPVLSRSALFALGLTSIAAAGFVAELTRRRRHQQRLRGLGQRIALPEPDSPAAITEQSLRAGADANTVTVVTRALDHICATHVAGTQPPPRLLLAFVSPDTVELALDPHAAVSPEAMRPFTPLASGRWVADMTALRAHQDDLAQIAGPHPSESYPALVSLGTSQGAVILANLEAAGTLTLTDSDDSEAADGAADVLRALVCEMATSPLSSRCTLTLSSQYAALADVTDASRLRILTPAALMKSFQAHAQQTRDMLAHAGAGDACDARARGVGDLAPQLWVCAEADTEPPDRAWSAHCVITTSKTPPEHGWHLKVGNGSARLEPMGVDLVPQHLDTTTYADMLELLATARRPATTATDEPAETDPATVDTNLGTAHGANGRHGHPRVTSQAVEPVVSTDRAPSQPKAIALNDQTRDTPTAHEPTEPFAPPAPRVLLLGPVQIDKPDGHADLRGRRLTELITYLALRPDATGPALDEALWKGQRISRGTRNALVYRARTWLGDAPDGTPYLLYADTDGYRLHSGVSCDWHDFQHHAHAAGSGGHDPVPELTAALDLVRDRPFLGIDPASYTWAERDIQTMISAIVDAAYQLAQLHLDRGDPTAAHAAALRGLQIDPVSELLYRMAITSAAQRHDAREIHRLEHQLRHQVNAIDPDADLDDETLVLLSSLRARA